MQTSVEKQVNLINSSGAVVTPESEEGKALYAEVEAYVAQQRDFTVRVWSVLPDHKMVAEWVDDFLKEKGYHHQEIAVATDSELGSAEAPNIKGSPIEVAVTKLRALFRR